MKLFLYLGIILLSLYSCNYEDGDLYHFRIYIDNESDMVIKAVKTVYKTDPDSKKEYAHWIATKDWTESIEPGKNYIFFSTDPWEGIYDEPTDTMLIFIFNADLLNEGASKSMLARYAINIDDIKKTNWHLTYPPSEVMQNFNIYPSYEEYLKQ